MSSGSGYLALGEGAFLKQLEFPAVYHVRFDELYEVDPTGFAELARCDGTLPVTDSAFPESFLEFCLDEQLLQVLDEPRPRPVLVGRNECPSLRYLMVEVTDRCNLSCRHCYLGDTPGETLALPAITAVFDEFERMGGMRLIVTGGEPLLHPGFAALSDAVRGRAFRSILVTNGTLLDEGTCAGLGFDEVQVSLDGMERGHEALRGEGSFRRTLQGIDCLRAAGRDLSIATMVHRFDLDELDELESLVRAMGAVSWTLDVPSASGRLLGCEEEFLADAGPAAAALGRAFGSEQHQPSGEYACGPHLACVRADGTLTKCGFYHDWAGGAVDGGLREAWRKLPKLLLSDLECDCEHIYDCGGGCRFRAEMQGGRLRPDLVKCAEYGVGEAL